jgi:hypothetical protein
MERTLPAWPVALAIASVTIVVRPRGISLVGRSVRELRSVAGVGVDGVEVEVAAAVTCKGDPAPVGASLLGAAAYPPSYSDFPGEPPWSTDGRRKTARFEQRPGKRSKGSNGDARPAEGGTTAQKKAAGRKGGKATARKSS